MITFQKKILEKLPWKKTRNVFLEGNFEKKIIEKQFKKIFYPFKKKKNLKKTWTNFVK